MNEIQKTKLGIDIPADKKKIYNLENRTFQFALKVRKFIQLAGKNQINDQYIKQIIRSSGSVAANYIEANESLSKKDFVYRIKLCRKEAKETCLWLRLIYIENQNSLETFREELVKEIGELGKIFTSILVKCKC